MNSSPVTVIHPILGAMQTSEPSQLCRAVPHHIKRDKDAFRVIPARDSEDAGREIRWEGVCEFKLGWDVSWFLI